MQTAVDKFAALRSAHTARLHDVRHELLRIKTLISFNTFESADRERLVYLAHKEAGTAGSFGLAELGDMASELEMALQRQAQHDEIASGLDRLLSEIDRALGGPA